MRFTNSPYEDFMKEKSYFKGVLPNLPRSEEHTSVGAAVTAGAALAKDRGQT